MTVSRRHSPIRDKLTSKLLLVNKRLIMKSHCRQALPMLTMMVTIMVVVGAALLLSALLLLVGHMPPVPLLPSLPALLTLPPVVMTVVLPPVLNVRPPSMVLLLPLSLLAVNVLHRAPLSTLRLLHLLLLLLQPLLLVNGCTVVNSLVRHCQLSRTVLVHLVGFRSVFDHCVWSLAAHCVGVAALILVVVRAMSADSRWICCHSSLSAPFSHPPPSSPPLLASFCSSLVMPLC